MKYCLCTFNPNPDQKIKIKSVSLQLLHPNLFHSLFLVFIGSCIPWDPKLSFNFSKEKLWSFLPLTKLHKLLKMNSQKIQGCEEQKEPGQTQRVSLWRGKTDLFPV